MSARPLFKSISAAAIPKITASAPQNLSNLAWSWSALVVSDEPLMHAISAQSLRIINDFNIQNLANTAWSYARLVCRNNPLMEAISASALKKIHGIGKAAAFQESYALLWSLWRTFDTAKVGEALSDCLASGLMADALVHGLLLSDGEWRMDAAKEKYLQIALGQALPPCALRSLLLPSEAPTLTAPIVFESMYHMYQKLSKCVDYVSATGTAGTLPLGSSHILNKIETFGQEVGQWLKVAAGDKASLTEEALLRCNPEEHEISAEFGAFVGFSGIRFARCVLSQAALGPQYACRKGLAGISLEVDPIHASVARHFINLAGLASSAEVWLGLLQDTLDLVAERVGEGCMVFSFMDQRGTTFHDDLALIEKLCLFPEVATTTADNVNKPGAPIFLWHMTRTRWFSTELWSMGEFASDDIEDWQSVAISNPVSPKRS